MKQWLSIATAACLLLFPFAAVAADYGSQPSQSQQVPPVAQQLVREGDFAIKLAAELDLGNPGDEANAEDLLTQAGIMPENGWLSDYPMTPEIIGQLQSSIAKAASEGNLPMNTDEATKGLYAVASRMNLPTPADSTSAPEGQQSSLAQPNPTVINNYYNDQGPPVITYYPPPYYDMYLYDWVPYPAFWFGVWFPGYYICRDFTTVVFMGDDDDFHHDRDFEHHDGRRGIVTNRVIDPVTRRVAVVDPVTKTSSGILPVSMLRTEQGRSFRNITEMRNVYGRQPLSVRNSAPANSGFRTPEARTSAGIIYSRSLERMGPAGGLERNMAPEGARGSVTRVFRGTVNPPPSREMRPSVPPSVPSVRVPDRPYIGMPMSRGNEWHSSPSFGSRSPGRTYRSPSWGNEGRTAIPSTGSRSFSAPIQRSRDWFSGGNGFAGSAGRGRSFSGGVCRGRC